MTSPSTAPSPPRAHAMPTRRLRRGLMVLGIIAVLLIGVLGHGLRQVTAEFQRQGESHRVASTLLMHTEFEVTHFAQALLRAALARDATAWASLPAHLRGLRGRIVEMGQVEMGTDHQVGAGLQHALPRLLATLAEIEAGLADLDSASGARLNPLLEALHAPIREAMLQLLAHEHEHARDATIILANRLLLFALGFMVLVAASTALTALLVAAWRQTRLALGHARAAEGEALAAHHTLRRLVDSVPALIVTFDTDLRCIYANRPAQEFFGLYDDALIGRSIAGSGLPPELEDELRAVRDSGRPAPMVERRRIDRLGQPRDILATTVPIFDSDGRLRQILRTGIDVTQRRQAEERVRHLAEHDALTDLPNRLRFKAELAARLAFCPRQALALHVIDLDGFRSVNDTHGQAMGDALLLAMTRRLTGLLRSHDMLARLGGDEFAVLQMIDTDADATALASRITQSLAQPYALGHTQIRCSASLGLAALIQGEATAEIMLARADLALAAARRQGIGQFRAFRPEMEGEALERRQLQAELGEALTAGALHLAYQPKFSLRDGRMEGVEALLRWTHPMRGPISPGEFVPLAEEAGLALPLARFVLQRAAAQIIAWQAIGLELPVAVNLSGELIGMAEALRMVENLLAETGIPARLLEIEVTESTFIGDSEAARAMLLGLRRLGIRVALDDFGTGFSSLSYLQQLPIDVLKIDRCFVAGLEAGGASARIVDTVVRLAHGLGARVVAEGVENHAQLEALRRLGCDSVQGFLLARPQPAADIPALIHCAPAKAPASRESAVISA